MRRYTPWIYLCIGLVLMIFPVASSTFFCQLIGLLALLLGGFRLYAAYRYRAWDFDLVSQAGLFLFGLIALVLPSAILAVLPLILGAILLVDGLAKLSFSWKVRQLSWLPFIMACLLSLLGLLILLDPFGLVINLFTFLGIVLVFNGLAELLIWSKYI